MNISTWNIKKIVFYPCSTLCWEMNSLFANSHHQCPQMVGNPSYCELIGLKLNQTCKTNIKLMSKTTMYILTRCFSRTFSSWITTSFTVTISFTTSFSLLCGRCGCLIWPPITHHPKKSITHHKSITNHPIPQPDLL